jgi:hypothetical protein
MLEKLWRNGMNEECGSGFDEVYMLLYSVCVFVDLLDYTLFNILVGVAMAFLSVLG